MIAARADLLPLLRAWIHAEIAGARRRQGVSFRAAADIRDLWLSLPAEPGEAA